MMGLPIPFWAILLPAVGGLFIVVTGRRPNLREGVTLVTAGLLAALIWSCYDEVVAADFWTAERPVWEVPFALLPGVHLAFAIEPLGLIYALIAATLWPLNSLYSIGYMRANNEAHQTRFYLCFAIALASAMGIAFAANFITLFVFYEVLTLSTFPLVAHKGTPAAVRSARTYLGILVGTSICLLLPAMIAIYSIVGHLDFQPGGILGDSAASPMVIGVLFLLCIYGIGKCALMPMHRWLPAAMVAPTPVSALLHAVAVVKAGVFAVLKVTVYVFGIDTLADIGYADWLVYLAGFTIVCASFIALFQDNLKRRLAYSTISQLSYIVLGAAMFNLPALIGGGMHIAAHAFGKITLFFGAGSIYTAAHKTLVSELDGIGRRMPWTMGAFTIGSLSMIGLPLTAGMISKWYLLQGAMTLQSGFVLAVLLCSTLLNACYFLPIIYRAFFRPLSPEAAAHPHGEAPWPVVVALCATAVGTVVLFFYPDSFLALMQQVAAGLPGSQEGA